MKAIHQCLNVLASQIESPYCGRVMKSDVFPHRCHRRLHGIVLAGLLCLLFGIARPCHGQSARGAGEGPEGLHVGLTLGGISFVGIAVEYVWGDRSLDITFGTWSFRDLSVSVVAKQYLGPGPTRPFVGMGLWAVGTRTHRTGAALVLHAPIGVDWESSDQHHLGMAMNINRALLVRRADPDDIRGTNDRLIPLPGFYYRWRR